MEGRRDAGRRRLASCVRRDAGRAPRPSGGAWTFASFDPGNAVLVLSKAKLFGIHTAMYRFRIPPRRPGTAALSGQTLFVYWSRDEPCPQINNTFDC